MADRLGRIATVPKAKTGGGTRRSRRTSCDASTAVRVFDPMVRCRIPFAETADAAMAPVFRERASAMPEKAGEARE